MEPRVTEKANDTASDSPDVLLDLGEFEPVRASADDDFVLDLDEDVSTYEPAPVRAFVEPQVKEAVAAVGAYESTYQPEIHSPFADTQEVPYASEMDDVAVMEPEPEPVFAEPEPAAARQSCQLLHRCTFNQCRSVVAGNDRRHRPPRGGA